MLFKYCPESFSFRTGFVYNLIYCKFVIIFLFHLMFQFPYFKLFLVFLIFVEFPYCRQNKAGEGVYFALRNVLFSFGMYFRSCFAPFRGHFEVDF